MKLTLFGRSGQVATEIRRLEGQGLEIEVIDRELADFADPGRVAAAARRATGDVMINAVAYTAVDRAEAEEDAALTVNARSVAVLAEIAAERNLPLVHLSTDYVFDGSGTAPRRPDHPTGPISAYGRTKLAGEDAIRAVAGPHAILRTSWVFSAHGSNFVKTMLRLGTERDRLSIVADQVGGPTPAAAIARTCLSVARSLKDQPEASGTYHFSGAPDVSWADFARAIFAEADLSVTVTDIATADYPTPARRPLNSRLDCATLRDTFGIDRPDWQAGLRAVLTELGVTR